MTENRMEAVAFYFSQLGGKKNRMFGYVGIRHYSIRQAGYHLLKKINPYPPCKIVLSCLILFSHWLSIKRCVPSPSRAERLP
jgi:hypothetical protein